MTPTRENGYYWVIDRDAAGVPDTAWSVAEFRTGYWFFCGDDLYHDESDIERVGDRIPPPA